MNDDKIRIGISSCLLGAEVRFDGGHKHHSYITGTLGRYFEFLPFCPEVAVGLGTPRQPIHLRQVAGEIRVVGVRDPSLEVTGPLRRYGREVARGLGEVDGYLFKKGSPSCGMERVKIYGEKGPLQKKGSGIFAEEIMHRWPLLPVEEEGRLGDPGLRENFVTRVFVHRRWRELNRGRVTARALVAFHSDHKYLIMAHNQAAYKRMGRLVAEAGARPKAARVAEYGEALMAALRRPATRKQHANVLQHLLGYLKRALDGDDKGEMVEVIDSYRQGLVPLVVPVTLLRHHFRRHPHPYVERQYYLVPHPADLALRNQI